MPTVIEPRSLKRPPDFAPPVDPELDWAAACALEADPPRRNRAPYIIAGLLVFALGTAAILYLFGVDTLPSFDAMSTMLGDYS